MPDVMLGWDGDGGFYQKKKKITYEYRNKYNKSQD